MKILIIDGQGGGIGKALVERIREKLPETDIYAVGANAAATAAMMRAGASVGVTGENALIFNCSKADVIIGPVGIVMANSMFGEISPAMAAAVTSCEAQKILIPISKCTAHIVGTGNCTLSQYIDEAIEILIEIRRSGFK